MRVSEPPGYCMWNVFCILSLAQYFIVKVFPPPFLDLPENETSPERTLSVLQVQGHVAVPLRPHAWLHRWHLIGTQSIVWTFSSGPQALRTSLALCEHIWMCEQRGIWPLCVLCVCHIVGIQLVPNVWLFLERHLTSPRSTHSWAQLRVSFLSCSKWN